jgi:hypothetical protein
MITARASKGRPSRSIAVISSGLFSSVRCCSNLRPTMRASASSRRKRRWPAGSTCALVRERRVGKIACRTVAAWARRARDFAHADGPSSAPLPTLPGSNCRPGKSRAARSWRCRRSAERRRGKAPLCLRGDANSSRARLAGDFFSTHRATKQDMAVPLGLHSRRLLQQILALTLQLIILPARMAPRRRR